MASFRCIGRPGTDVDDQEGVDGLKDGNQDYRAGKYEKAIMAYSSALKTQPADPTILLSNRCAAYCSFSDRLRNIPATRSEQAALSGVDPMSLVQMALKDVEKLIKLRPDWPKAYLRKGIALLLLEQYDQAKDAFLSGLQVDPRCQALVSSLSDLNTEFGEHLAKIEQTLKLKRAKVQRSEDLDCKLCLELLYNPITTPCGHSFCRACLFQAMDHGNKCPMCRTVLLSALIHTQSGARIMEGNHRMGMVGLDPDTGVVTDIACEVEICECEPMPDGRFFLEVEGRRCKIIKAWEQDGYRVARVQWIQDVVPPEGSPEKTETNLMVKEASKHAKSWIAKVQDGRSRLPYLMKQPESMPRESDPETISFWIANLLKTGPVERLRLLRMTDTREISPIVDEAKDDVS